MESAERPGQGGEDPAAEVSLKPPEAADEIPATASDLVGEIPTTAAELVPALFPVGDRAAGPETGNAGGNRLLPVLQRFGWPAVWARIRHKYK